MKINRVQIENYRNLKCVDVRLDNIVALIGENNSGKSNFLRASTLPLYSDEGRISKTLSWYDINNEVKDNYYDYIKSHKEDFINNKVDLVEFKNIIPMVQVTLEIEANDDEHYDVKDLFCNTNEDGKLIAGVQYKYSVNKPEELLTHVVEIISTNPDDYDSIKMSLLPMGMYNYEILLPGKNSKVSFDTLRNYKYVMLPAERDNFSSTAENIGSKALVEKLQQRLNAKSQAKIEQEYFNFFNTISAEGKFDQILNWQDYSDIANAGQLFDDISVLPNMPPMSNLINKVRLGYNSESLFMQGLGQRNMIFLMVMLNSYITGNHDVSLNVVEVEEPEAHLCHNNVLVMASFFNIFSRKSKFTQLLYSTHNSELVNKLGIGKTVVFHNGMAYSLGEELASSEGDYLVINPNTDIFKLLFSKRVILVEGITEELLIKAYLQTRDDLNDIKVLSFHKGFTKIINIWKKVNTGSENKLGVVRDNDNEPNAEEVHNALENSQIIVKTTTEYTLEDEIVKSGKNYELLREEYGKENNWCNLTKEQLADDWKIKKTGTMMKLCQDIALGKLQEFTMPSHIQGIIDFMM